MHWKIGFAPKCRKENVGGMVLRIDDINDLPPALRAQAERQLQRNKKPKNRQRLPKAPPADFESNGERDYYYLNIYPQIQSGKIIKCEFHKEFLLLPACEYCGLKLPAAKYTTDFFLTYQSGYQEAIEVKHKKIRQLQHDYIYRRRLFIEIHARPNGWGFREIITESEGEN